MLLFFLIEIFDRGNLQKKILQYYLWFNRSYLYILVIYYWLTNTLKLNSFRKMKIYYFSVFWGQESRHGPDGFFTAVCGLLHSLTRPQSRHPLGLGSHLKAWLGRISFQTYFWLNLVLFPPQHLLMGIYFIWESLFRFYNHPWEHLALFSSSFYSVERERKGGREFVCVCTHVLTGGEKGKQRGQQEGREINDILE